MKKLQAAAAAPFLSLLLVTAGLFLFPTAGQVTAFAGTVPVHRLVVLHTNDTHGHPVKFYHHPSKGAGGLPARATLFKKVRSEHPNVLVLDAGDINTGRPESNLFEAEPDILGYNAVGYDAMAVGNHEFDRGLSVLKRQMTWAAFPFLSANVKDRDGRPLFKPYIIKVFEGFRVAVFGLTTKSTAIFANPSAVKGLVFEDEVKTARRLVPLLKEKADLVIALVHMGLYASNRRGSKRIAGEVDGIDLIVDGHTHTRLEEAVMVTSPGGRRVPIVQAWKWGLQVGRVDLEIRDREVTNFRFRTIPINLQKKVTGTDGRVHLSSLGREIREDEAVLKMMAPYVEKTKALLCKKIGTAEKSFLPRGLRNRESALGDLVADSMLWHTRKLNPDFALQNGGGIRAGLNRGEITKATIHEIIPFDNTVMVLTLRGKDVKTLIDYMCRISPGSGAFPQISRGFQVTMNRRTGRCEGVLVNGRALDPDRHYRIATNSYLAEGGDGYSMLTEAVDKYDTASFQRDVLIEYIEHLGGRISPEIHGRIRITGSSRQDH